MCYTDGVDHTKPRLLKRRFMRLNKYLSNAGIGSRKDVKNFHMDCFGRCSEGIAEYGDPVPHGEG